MSPDEWSIALCILTPFLLVWFCCVCCSELRGENDEPCCEAVAFACDIVCVPGCWTNPLSGLWEFYVERRAEHSVSVV